MSTLIRELRRHQRDYASLVHGPLCGEAADAIDALVKALTDILEANKDFRDGMPQSWDGDPLQDACDAAAKLINRPVGRRCTP